MLARRALRGCQQRALPEALAVASSSPTKPRLFAGVKEEVASFKTVVPKLAEWDWLGSKELRGAAAAGSAAAALLPKRRKLSVLDLVLVSFV